MRDNKATNASIPFVEPNQLRGSFREAKQRCLNGFPDIWVRLGLGGGGRLNIPITVFCLAMGAAACQPSGKDRDLRRDALPWGSKVSQAPVAVAVTDRGNGVAAGTILANYPAVQVMRVDGGSPVSGTVLSFPPGTLMLPTEVRVEEGVSVAVPSLQAAIGLYGNVTQSGTPVSLLSSVPTDPVAPFSIALSLPEAASLMEANVSYAVAYKIVRYKDGTFEAGVIPSTALSVGDGKVTFSASYFGTYQVVVTKAPITASRALTVSTPLRTKNEARQMPAMQVTGRSTLVVRTGQRVDLSGRNFRPTMQLALGDAPIRAVDVASDVSASFVTPSVDNFGLLDLSIDQDGVSQTVSLIYRGGASDLPVITLAASEVCAGQKYYDERGQLQTGTKVCLTQASIPACGADGAVGCVTTANFPAAFAEGLAAKILVGETVAGVAGTSESRLPDCALDGSRECVARGDFFAARICPENGSNCYLQPYMSLSQPLKAISYDALAAGRGSMRSSLTLGGLTGYLVDCAADGATGCVATGNFKAVEASRLSPDNIKNGVSIGGVVGRYPSSAAPLASNFADPDLESFGDGTALGSYRFFDSKGNSYRATVADEELTPGSTTRVVSSASTLYRQVTVPGDVNLIPTNIKAGVSIFGSSGEIHPAPEPCSANKAIDCVATTTYRAADFSNLTPANIRSAVTVAGVVGAFPSVTHPLVSAETAEDLSVILTDPNKPTGSYQFFDSAGVAQSISISDAQLTATTDAQTIHNLGTLYRKVTLTPVGGGGPSSCTSNGEQGCLVSGEMFAAAACGENGSNCYIHGYTGASQPFKAVDVTKVALANAGIRRSLTVAGVAGTLAECSTDGGKDCVATDAFKSVDTTKLVPQNIKQAVTIAGVTGTVIPTPGNCSTNGSQGCVANGSYFAATSCAANGSNCFVPVYSKSTKPLKAINFDTIDTNRSLFRTTLNLAGVQGLLATCAADGATGCVTDSAYPAVAISQLSGDRIKAGVSLGGVTGTYGPACLADGATDCVVSGGSPFRAANISGISPWDLRAGKTYGGIDGRLVFYTNLVGTFNNKASPALTTTDVYDTIDDDNNGGAFPSLSPWTSPTVAPGGNWTSVSGACDGVGACVLKDQTTGVMWTATGTGFPEWGPAITYCDNLAYNGLDDWRLPTQKELMQAYVNGLWSQKIPLKLRNDKPYWSASTYAKWTGQGWAIFLNTGETVDRDKTIYDLPVVCVR